MEDFASMMRKNLKVRVKKTLHAIKLHSPLHNHFVPLSKEWMESEDFERIYLLRCDTFPVYYLRLKASKPFLKTVYCYFDELCSELKLDPENFSELYYNQSVDFIPNKLDIPTARFEFYMSDDSTCRLITEVKTYETTSVIGYKC